MSEKLSVQKRPSAIASQLDRHAPNDCVNSLTAAFADAVS